MAIAVRECQRCGQDFAQERRPGRPRAYCDVCRANTDDTPVPDGTRDDWVAEVSRLTQEADALEQEAAQLEVAAKARRGEAAKARARADRLAGAVASVQVRRQPTALDRVRDDGLLAAAGLASEDMPAGFTARDLAAALGIADVARAGRLLAALVELEKVTRHGDDGYLCVDEDERAVRDYVVATREFAIGDAIVALGLTEEAMSFYLARLGERGLVEGAGGFYRYVEAPNDAPRERPRRRPPELDPPAGTDAPKRGEPVRIVDHGQGAKAGGKHKMNLKQKAWERQERAREERAEEQRRKARGQR
jgi:DNA-binding transcriptional ArsR family regulator